VKRALAVISAVAMIGLSLFVRGRIDDKGSGSSTSSSSSALTIACIPELATECQVIASDKVKVTIEDATTTLPKLDQYDGWLTLDPWPAIAQVQQQSNGGGTPINLGSSILQVAVVKDRAAALTATCGGTITWKCLGERRGQQWSSLGGDASWGPLKVGLPPKQSATGLLLYADAIASYFGRVDYGTNDFDAEFIAWQSNLRGAFGEPAPFDTFVAQLPAAYTAVGATSAQTLTRVGAKADRISLVDATARAVVVLAPMNGRDLKTLAKSSALQQALQADGWSGDPNAPSGLPAAGVLLALLTG